MKKFSPPPEMEKYLMSGSFPKGNKSVFFITRNSKLTKLQEFSITPSKHLIINL